MNSDKLFSNPAKCCLVPLNFWLLLSITTFSFLTELCPAAASGANVTQQRAKSALTMTPDVAGLVLNATGEWQIRTDTGVHKLHTSDAVPDGGTLQRQSSDGTITIILTDGSKMECPGCANCSGPISVAKHKTDMGAWLTTAMSFFVKRPNDWVVTESRDGLSASLPNLQDAVLLEKSATVNLSPIFKTMPANTFYVTLYKLASGHSMSRSLGPLEMCVEPGKDAILNTKDLAAGLYKVILSSDKDDPTGAEAWALISEPNLYEKRKSDFATAMSQARPLREEISDDRIRELLRAYLSSLSTVTHVEEHPRHP